jgi:hypothetical protein
VRKGKEGRKRRDVPLSLGETLQFSVLRVGNRAAFQRRLHGDKSLQQMGGNTHAVTVAAIVSAMSTWAVWLYLYSYVLVV